MEIRLVSWGWTNVRLGLGFRACVSLLLYNSDISKTVRNAFEMFTSSWILRHMAWKATRIEVVGTELPVHYCPAFAFGLLSYVFLLYRDGPNLLPSDRGQ